MRLTKLLGAVFLFGSTACTSPQPEAATTDTTRDGRTSRDGDSADPLPGGSRDARDEADEVTPGAACASIRRDAPPARAPIDVVWVIDTSASMLDEFQRIQANLTSFMREFESSTADTRVAMLTALDPAFGTPLAADTGRYRFVPAGVDSKQLYETARRELPRYQDFLRAGAATHLVMVTDDQDRVAADAFRRDMEAALGHPFTLHAIASPEINGLPCASAACGGIWIPFVCGAMSVGSAYNTLASETGGEQISICTEDWGEVFARLRTAVIASALPCDYPLAEAGSGFDPARVQVVYTPEGASDREFPKTSSDARCGSESAWYYDDPEQPTRITLCPAACEEVQAGGSIDVALGCPPSTVI